MLALLLGLGLCTSVLVAWAGALVDRTAWPDTILTRRPTGTRTEVRGWLVEEGRDRTLTWRTFNALDLWDEPPDLDAPTQLPWWSAGHDLADQPGPFAPARERTRDMAWEVSAGWPMRCVRAERRLGRAINVLPGRYLKGGVPAIAVAWPVAHERIEPAHRPSIETWPFLEGCAIVPFTPLPVGLLVNAVAYALAWSLALLPLAVSSALRRRRRRSRGRCVRCGHSREGLPGASPCPECGHAAGAGVLLVRALWPPAVVAGASVVLVATMGAAASLATHRWMAIDRLPPVHHAAATGDVRTIERLLATGEAADERLPATNFFSRGERRPTPLVWAIEGRHPAAVRALVDAGAAVNAQGPYADALDLAFWVGHDEIVRTVLEALPAGPPPSELLGLLPYGSDAIRERALERFEWSEFELRWAADRALDERDMVWFERLAAEGIDPEAYMSNGFLSTAVAADYWGQPGHPSPDTEPLRRLFELGFDRAPMAVPSAVETAVLWGNVPALEFFIEREPALARRLAWLPADALMSPVAEGRAAMVARLAELGVDLDATDREGNRALVVAAVNLQTNVVKTLLEAGANPTALVRGRTAREHLADDEGLRDRSRARRIIELLQAAEADWTARAQNPTAPGPR
jgi:hypothetical protein